MSDVYEITHDIKSRLTFVHNKIYFDRHGIYDSAARFASIVGTKVSDSSDDGIYKFINNNIADMLCDFTDKNTISLLKDILYDASASDNSSKRGKCIVRFVDYVSDILENDKYSRIKYILNRRIKHIDMESQTREKHELLKSAIQEYESKYNMDKFNNYIGDDGIVRIGRYVIDNIIPMIGMIPELFNGLLDIINAHDHYDIFGCITDVILYLNANSPSRNNYKQNKLVEENDNMSEQINENVNAEMEGNGMFGDLGDMFDNMMPRRVGSDEVAIMMDGNIAIKRKNGDYVAYNKVTGGIFNAKKMVIVSEKISNFVFLMPTASNMLAEGDIINNNGCYYYVKKCGSGGIRAINLSRGTNSTITDEDNIFGMPTYMKLVSIFGGMQTGFGGMQIGFGGINPMIMMAMCDNYKNLDPMMMVMCGMFGTNMVQQQFQPQQMQYQQEPCWQQFQPQQNCANTNETTEE